MPQKPEDRDYDVEYPRDHKSDKAKKDRAARNRARKNKGLKKGDGKEVDHKTPLSKGGSRNSPKNQRVVSRKTNRKKADK